MKYKKTITALKPTLKQQVIARNKSHHSINLA